MQPGDIDFPQPKRLLGRDKRGSAPDTPDGPLMPAPRDHDYPLDGPLHNPSGENCADRQLECAEAEFRLQEQ